MSSSLRVAGITRPPLRQDDQAATWPMSAPAMPSTTISISGCTHGAFTRLTNAFSKKLENHACAMSLHFMYYNFVRIHQTLKVTPAMAAGVTDKLWEIADIVTALEDWEFSR